MNKGGNYMKKLLVPIQTVGLLALSAGTAFAQIPPFLNIPQSGPVKINDLGFLIGAILGFLLIVAAILAFIYLILGGIQWITSGGDKSQLEAARNKITSAIVGLIVVASAWAIMALVQTFLGLNLFGAVGEALPRAFR